MNRLRALSGRLSITARITVGSFVVAVLIGVVAVVGIRLGVSAILDSTTLTLLRHDAEPFAEQVLNDPTDIDAAPGEGQYVAIVAPSGDVRMTSLPKSLRVAGTVPLGSEETTVRVSTPGHRYIVRTAPVETSSGVWHVVSARNEDANDIVLGRLSAALIIGAAVLVAFFTAASFILARTALRPVNEMRRQADELARRQSGATDVEARSSRRSRPGAPEPGSDTELLEVPPVRDELAALAVTLNGLIEALRASADREKQLVSDASHELRTPLAVLRGELELAELDAGDPDALLTDVRQAQQTVLRLSTLATNLLELSRIDSQRVRGSATWTDLEDELAAAIDRMRQAAAMRGIQCVIDFEVVGGPHSVGAQSIALSTQEFGRIVDNLISNAITAIDAAKGAGTVTARLAWLAPDAAGAIDAVDRPPSSGPARSADATGSAAMPGAIELTVVDDGPGMPADFVPVAFDRFTRVDQARTSSTGSGLGLAIVAALVDAARGSIRLSPSAAGGLAVDITLPLGK